MNTLDELFGSVFAKCISYPLLPRPFFVGVSFDAAAPAREAKVPSSKCPAGVRRRAPSGEKVRRLKKLVKFSSPYNRAVASVAGAGELLTAGNARGGMGEGERAMRELNVVAGEPGACELNEDRREEAARSKDGGGNMTEGVLDTLAVGVRGAPPRGGRDGLEEVWIICATSSLKSLMLTDSASDVVESRRPIRGREVEPGGREGVRECLTVRRVFFPIE
jgi:hypothetical protein